MITSVDHDGWAEVWLDRADKRNALSHALVDQLLAALGGATSAGRRVVVLGARGPVFCAGGDRAEVRTSPVAADRLIAALRATEAFVVARVEGPALGSGVSVLRSVPVVLCTPAARFGLPEASMGNFPVPSAYLEGVVPARRIVEVGLGRAQVGAAEAASLGLATAVVKPADLDGAVAGWVATLLERPVVADQARRYWQAQFGPAFEERERWWRDLVGAAPAPVAR